MRITLLLVLCALGCAWALPQDYQEEDRRSKLRSPRGPVIPSNRALSKNQLKPVTSTTTPEPPPPAEDELYDEEYADEGAEVKETTTTTTEAPKKGIRGGVLRPFRSNTDLIEALKRRRAQISSERGVSTHSPPSERTTSTTEAPKASNNRQSKNLSNRKFSRGNYEKPSSSTEQPAEEPTQRTRSFAGRAGRRF